MHGPAPGTRTKRIRVSKSQPCTTAASTTCQRARPSNLHAHLRKNPLKKKKKEHYDNLENKVKREKIVKEGEIYRLDSWTVLFIFPEHHENLEAMVIN
jgi:hypothetical protein